MVQTTIQKNSLCAKYAADCTHGAAYITAPGATQGTEPTGGNPAYARKPLAWTGADPISANANYDIPAGSSIAGVGLHDALTGGNYRDGTAFAQSQPFVSQGTYGITYTYTQT